MSAAGCGSSTPKATTTVRHETPAARLTACLKHHGYAVTPESPADVATAPRRFKFVAVWNVLNPTRVALAITFSTNTTGAKQAVVWTRRTNAKIAKGLVRAPVVRIGKVDVLWTSTPGRRNAHDVYGCIRSTA